MEKRNSEERRLKLKGGAGLAVDLAVLALVAVWSPERLRRLLSSTARNHRI